MIRLVHIENNRRLAGLVVLIAEGVALAMAAAATQQKEEALRFTDVSLADYVTTFKLFENAERQGWKKDFDRMEKIVEDANE